MVNELKLLKNQNENATEKLTDENQEILIHILKYVTTPKIGAFDREIIRKDLIGMAIEAESRGENLSDIIGKDQKFWCESLVDSYGTVSFKELTLYTIQHLSILWLGLVVGSFKLTPSLVSVNSLKLSIFILFSLFSIGYNFFIGPKFAFKSLTAQFMIEVSVFIIPSIVLIPIGTFLNKIVLFKAPNYIIYLIFLSIWGISTLLYQNLIHQQSKKINWLD